MPRPYGGFLPRRVSGAGSVAARRSDELAREAGLADPGVASDRHELGHPVTGGPAVDELEQCHVVVAADEGQRSSPIRSVPADFARQTRRGSGKPLASTASASWTSEARQARAARSPISTSPGAAACWRRAAAFTASPVTDRSSPPSSARTSPVSIPTRTARSLVHGRDPLGQGERSRDRPVRVVGVDPRDPEHGEHRVADVLLDGPAVLLQRRARHLEERRETPRGAPPGPGPTPSRSSRRGRRRPSSRAFARRRQAPREASRTRGRSARHHPPKHRNEHRSEPCADDTLGPGATVARLHPGRAPGAQRGPRLELLVTDAHHRAGQVALVAGRRGGLQRVPGRGRRDARCCSTAATASSRSCAERVDYTELDAVLISHLHADHFLDLVPYSYALTYAPRQQPVPGGRLSRGPTTPPARG